MAERSKAPDSSKVLAPDGVENSGPLMWAWVRTPLLTIFLAPGVGSDMDIRDGFKPDKVVLQVPKNLFYINHLL